MPDDERYFEWIVNRVFGKCAKARLSSHGKLLRYLFDTPYYWRIDLDSNRFADGVSLRWIYFKETGDVDPIQDDSWCSILEMMAALADRCEKDIMANDVYGNRTREWFWDMVKSLGLADQTDDVFDEGYCDEVIRSFIQGDYDYDGTGGLFTFRHPHYDIRDTEIWKQLQWFLQELRGG